MVKTKTLRLLTQVTFYFNYTMGDSDSDFERLSSSKKVIRPKKTVTHKSGETSAAGMAVDAEVLVNNVPRRVYLITYSHVDKVLFPSRESFGKKCEEVFGGENMVSFYACCEEPHATGGIHYHVSIKLKKPQRWGTAKKKLSDVGAVVNFSKPGNMKDVCLGIQVHYQA